MWSCNDAHAPRRSKSITTTRGYGLLTTILERGIQKGNHAIARNSTHRIVSGVPTHGSICSVIHKNYKWMPPFW